MTHYTISHILAATMLVCCSIVLLVDLGTEFEIPLAIKLKWTLFWSTCRYLGIICGVLLALDVYF